MSRTTDLYLVGTGIRSLLDITAETADVLRNCRIVFDLTHQPRRMKRLNPNTVNLERLYWTGEECVDVYRRLVDLVLEEINRGPGVALATYGHPLLFDDVNMELLRLSKRGRFTCRALPAVSCLDTLSIDLGIDYGDGLQVFESWDVVINEHVLNPAIHALLLQVGEFGWERTGDTIPETKGRLRPLERYLRRYYPAGHPAVIVFSDNGQGALKLNTRIDKLDYHRRRILPGATLYLPPR